MLAFFLPLLRADLAVSENYAVDASETVTVPIFAIGGTEDPRSTRRSRGLGGVTPAVQGRFLVGGHFFLHDQRAELLAIVRSVLAASRLS